MQNPKQSYVFPPFADSTIIYYSQKKYDQAIEQYEKKIFGVENSVQADIAQLKNYLGGLYTRAKKAWAQKTDAHRKKMENEGYIVNAELTDNIIQEAADTLMELETSEKLQALMTREVKRLNKSEKEGQKALQEFTAKVIGEQII